MGFNTVVVVLNDAVHMIAEDTSWGASLARAVSAFHSSRRRAEYNPIPARGNSGRSVYCNSAEVISQAHADSYQVVVAHGNTGWAITADPDDGVPPDAIKHLEWTLKARRTALKKKAAA